jgi:hypothetical protein
MNTPTTNLPTGAAPAAPLPISGSGAGAAAVAASTTGLAPIGAQGAVVVPLDSFAKRGGPDVAVRTDGGLVRVHAIFQIDPKTRALTVSVVDEAGQVIRMIPADSVSRMIAAMSAYRGR